MKLSSLVVSILLASNLNAGVNAQGVTVEMIADMESCSTGGTWTEDVFSPEACGNRCFRSNYASDDKYMDWGKKPDGTFLCGCFSGDRCATKDKGGRYDVAGYEFYHFYKYSPPSTKKIGNEMEACKSENALEWKENVPSPGKCADYCMELDANRAGDKYIDWGKKDDGTFLCGCYSGDTCGTDSGRYAVAGYEYYSPYEYTPRQTEKVYPTKVADNMESCSSDQWIVGSESPRLDTAGKCGDFCLSKQSGPDDKFFNWGKRSSDGNSVCFCYSGDACSTDSGRYDVTGSYDYYGIYKYSDMTVQANARGDPHFTTFNGTMYDFHGGCDLVLLSNADFDHGRGLYVHARTQIESTWSRIDAAAIKLGGNSLEIKAGNKKIQYWLDGTEVSDMETGDASLGDHAIRFKRINEHQSQTRLDLGHGNALGIETFKKFVRVNVKVVNAGKFVGTYGMYGTYPGGELIGRDKSTVFENTDEFGFEWQVRTTDPQIFHSAGPIQPPMKCLMPDMTKKSQARRRLGEAAISEEEAALACARVNEHDKDACIFDVLATNDKDMAGSY